MIKDLRILALRLVIFAFTICWIWIFQMSSIWAFTKALFWSLTFLMSRQCCKFVEFFKFKIATNYFNSYFFLNHGISVIKLSEYLHSETVVDILNVKKSLQLCSHSKCKCVCAKCIFFHKIWTILNEGKMTKALRAIYKLSVHQRRHAGFVFDKSDIKNIRLKILLFRYL